jgi:uncharacterized protein YdcH (DUF465 family)
MNDPAHVSSLQTDDGFQRLVSEHQALDERIRHLASQAYLTEEQQFEEIRLKKQKLALKDRIQALTRVRHPGDTSPMPQH